MVSSAVRRALLLVPLLVAACVVGSEARAFFPIDQFNQLLSVFDPSGGIENGTSLLEQFFFNHAQHSLASMQELADIGQTFFQG